MGTTRPAGVARLGFPLTALLLGLLHALSFAPTNMWWLQTLAFSGLCLLILMSPHRALMAGWLFGLGTFSAGLSWMFISMYRFGGMPAPMAMLAVLLLSSYLAAFGAIATRLGVLTAQLLTKRQQVAPYTLPLCVAAFWTMGEIARGLVLTGFPWLSVGYAHVDGPFSGLAAWFGVYGIGGAATLTSALLAALLCRLISALRQRVGFALPGVTTLIGSLIAVTGVSHAAGLVQFATPSGDKISVRLMQGNVEQQLKFDPRRTLRAMSDYVAMVRQGSAQLNVLPETAWTVGFAQTPPALLASLGRHLKESGGLFATGMPVRARASGNPGNYRLTNSVVTLDGRQTVVNRYDKRHLVPFGEFIPTGFRWFIDMMKVPLGDFGRGNSDQRQLMLDSQQIAFNICYEDLFGEEIAVQVRNGANILINVSNIGWFGQSHALPQHLNISRLRAMEFQRPMLRSTNTGVTAHISPTGDVLDQLPVYRHAVLDVKAQPMGGLTPFARGGLWLPMGLALALVLAAAAGAISRVRPDP